VILGGILTGRNQRGRATTPNANLISGSGLREKRTGKSGERKSKRVRRKSSRAAKKEPGSEWSRKEFEGWDDQRGWEEERKRVNRKQTFVPVVVVVVVQE
jgi:hypothetical protein